MTKENTTKRMERMQKALRENLLKRKKQQRERKEERPQPQPETAQTHGQRDTHTSLLIILMGLAALTLAGCGKKGSPEPLEPDTFPRTYPKG